MSTEQTRLQAQDENIAPEVLAELANSEDYLTRQYVASNPNTPTEALLKLGAEFPRELLDNPIFDLLLLENLNLISEIPITTLQSLVKQDNIPESFIIKCAERESDKDMLLGLTINSTISRSILEKLNKSRFPEVVEAAELHVNWSREKIEGWKELVNKSFFSKIISPKGFKKTYYLENIADLGGASHLCSK